MKNAHVRDPRVIDLLVFKVNYAHIVDYIVCVYTCIDITQAYRGHCHQLLSNSATHPVCIKLHHYGCGASVFGTVTNDIFKVKVLS